MVDNAVANPDLAYDATTAPKTVVEPEKRHHVSLATGDKEWDHSKHAKRPNHERHTGVRASGMRHAPESEKKHGAGKGNWGNEKDGEEVLEEENADQMELAEHILAEEGDAEAKRAQREAVEPSEEEANLKTLDEYENGV